jgi:hypothetical protein
MNFPVIQERSTRWQVAMDTPAIALSKAAVASKSVRTPGDRDCRDKSQNKTLFNTVLLHVSPGIAYWDEDSARRFFAWHING